MGKVPTQDLPIHVYTCVTYPERPAMAFIGNLPVSFRGSTPMKAAKAAKDFREAEMARLAKGDGRKSKKVLA